MKKIKRQLKTLFISVLMLGLIACASGGGSDPAGDSKKTGSNGSTVQLTATTGLEAVSNFGSNPGNLAMYKYIPAGVSANAPLVVVLHGCQQKASEYSRDTEWNKLADRFKFYVIYAEENTTNQTYACFRFYDSGQQVRGKGEALSIVQMVDKMKADYSIDSKKVFVTGLSAGGAMTLVMLAAYPDVFAAGGVNAAVAYKCDNDALTVFNSCMKGNTNRTADDLKTRAKSAYPGYSGAYPKLIAFQGTQDEYVNSKNLAEIVKQWTALAGTDQNPDISGTFKGYPYKVYTKDNTVNGQVVIQTHEITGMKHGITVDPGTGEDQGGVAQAAYPIMGTNYYFAYDFDFYSSYYIAKFFDILDKAPVVNISNPAEGANLSGNVVISANLSSEAEQLTKVELKIGGELRDSQNINGLSYNYSYNWNVDNEIYGGTVSVEIIAYNAKTSTKKSITVKIDKPERISVSADKASGSYDGTSLPIVLNSSRPSVIYYSTDGSMPTESSLNISSGSSITLNAVNGAVTDYTVKFFAKESSGQTSLVETRSYKINPLRYTSTANGTCIDHLSANRITSANFMTYYNKYSYNTKFDMFLLKDGVSYTPKSGTKWADKIVDADAWK